jgi:LmbE family N-acetylglucosaminyl deacetylase
MALSRATHLGIGAHPDDIEFMAAHGVLECFGRSDRRFGAVVVTDGARSPRARQLTDLTDAQMREARLAEQRAAAVVGKYAASVMLGFSSEAVRAGDPGIDASLDRLLACARPEVVYTHNLADKHDTHVAVALRVIAALRRLPPERRPHTVYGCEVWRGLDWMLDEDKRVLDVSDREPLQLELMQVFESQIGAGKRYDLATMGRRRANATYLQPRAVDVASLAQYAMDLTPLIRDPALDPRAYVLRLIERFSEDVAQRLDALSPRGG